MRYILLVATVATLVACAREVHSERIAKSLGAAYEINLGKRRTAKESQITESLEFSYIGLTLNQAEVAAGERNKRFRVIKRDSLDLPVTFDFVYGRINAELVDGVVVGFSVEGRNEPK
jgi:hypothetical protein